MFCFTVPYQRNTNIIRFCRYYILFKFRTSWEILAAFALLIRTERPTEPLKFDIFPLDSAPEQTKVFANHSSPQNVMMKRMAEALQFNPPHFRP